MSKVVLRFLDYVFLLRPTLFLGSWTIFLAGVYSVQRFNGNSLFFNLEGLTTKIWLNLFAFTLVVGGTFILNQISDKEVDKENEKLFLLADGFISLHGAIIETIIVLAVGLGIGYGLFGLQNGLMLTLMAVLWGYLYNFEPFTWKDKPILGLLANIFGGAIMFSAGWTLYGNISWGTLLLALPYLSGFAAVTVLTMIPDETGDALYDKETFIIKFGLKSTVHSATVLIIVAGAVGLINSDPLISSAAFLALPWYVYSSIIPGINSSLGAIRFSALFLGLAICAKFPVYLLLLALTFFVSRIYYKRRFGLNYPVLNMDRG